MKSNINISVIIPCYNQEKYLRDCLDSIVNQKFSGLEVVCVDDGSTDKTLEILQDYKKNYSCITLISYKKNQGTSQARKDAVLASSGKYIMFCDPDDTFDSKALKTAFDAIEKNKTDMVQFGTNVINCGVSPATYDWFVKFVEPYDGVLKDEEVFFECFENEKYGFNLWNKIYNGEVVRRAFNAIQDGYFPKAQDMYAFMLIAYLSKSYSSISAKLYNYYYGRGITGKKQITLNQFEKNVTQLNIIEELLLFFSNNIKSDNIMRLLNVMNYRWKVFCNEIKKFFGHIEDYENKKENVLKSILSIISIKHTCSEFKNKTYYDVCVKNIFRFIDELRYNYFNEYEHLILEWAKDTIKTNDYIFENIDSLTLQDILRMQKFKKTKKQIIPIVLATNDNYAPYLAVTLQSLIENCDNSKCYDIYVFNSSLNYQYQRMIADMSTENINISTLNVMQFVKNLPLYSKSHYSVEMFYRILIPEILSEYKKVVYLDCDIVVLDDISKLFNTDLKHKILACINNTFLARDGMVAYVQNSLKIDAHKYFNSGILVIDSEKFVRNGIKEKCFSMLEKYQNLACPDQDILNLALEDQVLYLDNKWNYQIGSEVSTLVKYSEKPHIIHYTTAAKPWNTKELPLGEYFWKYAKNCSFYEIILSRFLTSTLNIKATTEKTNTEERVIINNFNMYKHKEVKKTALNWPYRVIKRFINNWKQIGFKRANQNLGNQIKYAFNRLRGKVDVDNNQIVKRETKDYNYYKNLPVSKYASELQNWYINRTNEKFDIENPVSLNEKIQWLKLYDSTILKSHLTDKWLAKEYIKKVLGEKYIIKTLGVYDKFEDIDFDKLPNKFVIKSTHGSGQVIIVKNKNELDLDQVKQKVNNWISKNYAYSCGLEIHYHNIIPRIIIEEFMEGINDDLFDYKVMCINGKPEFVWVDSNRFIKHKRNLYDLDWNLLPVKYHYEISENPIPKPKQLKELLKLSEKLAKNFALVRCDFYILTTGEIKFGELTFTSCSGIDKWSDKSYDINFGKKITLPKKTKFKKYSRKQIIKAENEFLKNIKKMKV